MPSQHTNHRNLTIDSKANDQYPDFTKTTSPGGGTDTYSFESNDEILPPTHKRRTLVLCFDGTGDQFDEDNSNVVNFFSTLKKDDSKKQLVYYQSGIGTYTIPQIAKPTMAKFHKAMDAMIGVHLNAHVMSGYEFLMQNYEAGDKICIFGFSRGAYTARALGGMIHKIGLLPKCNHQQVPFAYKMYSREDEIGWKQSTSFKKAFCIDVDIEFLGVWETVGSVGMIPKRLPFTTSNTHVRYFRHALALDERRVRFKPNFWVRFAPGEPERGTKHGDMPRSKSHEEKTLRELERQYTDGGEYTTDVEEVWFAGAHCDVGGGAVKNEVRHNLARIPLRWMIRQCFLTKTGILFYREMLPVFGMDPDSLWPVVKPRPPPVHFLSTTPNHGHKRQLSMGTNRTLVNASDFISEEEEDLADVLSKINDMLEIARTWWVLEFIPQKIRFQNDEDSWVRKLSINRGRGRVIPKQNANGIKIHRSVKLRLDAKDKEYTPKAKWNVEPTWVD
ncbi:hypothetical protein BDZ94DRAFT_1166859 [Collybia nuda]|uniref:T6SS Phospholipase effector Tle1-like catalytic domain-containing protein n=1 Tax=Collybia nuda TaxID=64659 RepID=A0A9P6CDL8_9AGAR|nr:hypothetical protein BDZ94DRAFT_1166859 [Collybia nuda]